MCPQAHIISEATSLPKATSFAQKGKHHSKNHFLRSGFLWPARRDSEPRFCAKFLLSLLSACAKSVKIRFAAFRGVRKHTSKSKNTRDTHTRVPCVLGPLGGIRTPVLWNRNPLRYPASPRAVMVLFTASIIVQQIPTLCKGKFLISQNSRPHSESGCFVWSSFSSS